jgi:peptidoglycan/xylan/chitin deacetylase (PgdA/CDA1 family)
MLKKEDIFNPYLNADLKNYLDNYYGIILPSTLNNMTKLEKQIYELVSPRSIMFHYFHNDDVKQYGQGSISENDLEKLINKIGRKNILDIDDWLEKFNNCTLKKGEVCFTIDDGLKNQYDVALPILNKYNIKAGWYIYTNPINKKYEILDIYKYFCGNYYDNYDLFYRDFFSLLEKEDFLQYEQECLDEKYLENTSFYTYIDRLFRYIRDVKLTKNDFTNYINILIQKHGTTIEELVKNIWISEEEIKELSNTQSIGLHSTSHHTRMDLLNHDDQYNEYNNNKQMLEKIIEKPIFTTTYPCGRYNEYTFDIQKKLNIKYAFISYLENIDLNEKNMKIQRIDSTDALKEYL